ncbi:hypothetical protein [Maritalea sp.]|uniref:hypothetical protein n=1 Tax=Maritalea sp. TaxID=2003361 RepID=UPI003EF99E72
MIRLNEHFKADVRHRHTEWLRQQRWFIKSRQAKLRSDEAADKAEQALTAFAAEVIMATEIQIQQFNTKLDCYDEATVAALMDNQVLLDQLNSIRLSLPV